MKLTAKIVPYSSVVGQSVALHDEAGAVVAIVIISIPDPSRNYKDTARPIAEQIKAAFLSPRERLANLRSAFAENDIPFPA